jgi:hypothetical protein
MEGPIPSRTGAGFSAASYVMATEQQQTPLRNDAGQGRFRLTKTCQKTLHVVAIVPVTVTS